MEHSRNICMKITFYVFDCTGIVHVKGDSASYSICLVGNLANDDETKEAAKSKLIKLVYYMSGSIKNDINGKVSHLVANSSTGEKHHYSDTIAFRTMSEDWINSAWAHRDEIKVKAPSFLRHKSKLFHNLKIVIAGFSEEDRTSMEGLIKDYGSISTALEDSSASHFVVDDQIVLEKPSNCSDKALVVKADWFWASLQVNSCNVASFLSPHSRVFSPGTPGTRSSKRKRLLETVQQLTENDSPSDLPTTFPPARKRRPSVGDLTVLSSYDSFLEDSLQSSGTPCYDKTPLSSLPFDSRLLPPRQRIATVRVAIEVCNNPELKKKILFPPWSNDYSFSRIDECKIQWNEIVEKKAAVILENIGISKQLREKVIGVVLLVGMRMLYWAEYHEGTLGFSREYSVNFLKPSFFTQQGIIDYEKTAEELMKDQSLNIKQKYKLACLYCCKEHIPGLYRQMTKKDQKIFYDAQDPQNIKQPELVKFWSYYQMGEIDKLKLEEKSLDQYRLEKAVESGCKVAVEYCLERPNLRRKKDAIIGAAVETIRNRIIRKPFGVTTIFDNIEKDWVVFCSRRYKDSEKSWVPSDYYIDILHTLLVKMRDDQKIEFLKKDIEGATYRTSYRNDRHSRTLEYFLNWPYQDYFMKTAGMMWEFLPEISYADLLLEICNKIEPKKENLWYGEERSFDYRKLLKEFWNESPERYKRYVLSDKEITYRNGANETIKKGKELLIKLFSLKNFTYEDRKIIELILADATNKEKENIIFSQEGKNICIRLMKEEKWEILDEFVSNSFPSEGQANKFKREFTFTIEAQRICIDFVKNDKWDSAESFIKWSALLEEENKFKKEMICSEDGLDACIDLISCDKKVEVVDRFIKWCFPSAEEIETFKKELVLSYEGICKCVELVTGDQVELADEFINLGLSSEKEIRELKKNVAYRRGYFVCQMLISHYSEEDIYEGWYIIGTKVKFEGGKWEEVEKLLTWCFSSEEEISEFKRKLYELSGIDIHYSLITASKWEEAEIFFAWLGLSAKEIRKLKKETLLSELMDVINSSLFRSWPPEGFFVQFLGDAWDKWEGVELYLRWCLIDKETVLEFKNRYDEAHGFKGYENEGEEIPEDKRVILNEFYLLIEELLNNLSQSNLTIALSGNI